MNKTLSYFLYAPAIGHSKFQQSTKTLTNFQGKVHTQVDVLSPDVVGSLGVEHRVDATV